MTRGFAETVDGVTADRGRSYPRQKTMDPGTIELVPAAPFQPAVQFTVRGVPVGKPRMTQRDKWQSRPCVVAYRAWADLIRLAAHQRRWPRVLQGRIRTVFYLPFPRSYTERKREGLRGQPHQSRPDGDNLHKAVLDALFKDDAFIWDGQYTSYWDDGQGPRAEIALQ